VRHRRRTDRRPLWAFLLLVAVGAGLLLWAPWQGGPAAQEAAAGTGAAAGSTSAQAPAGAAGGAGAASPAAATGPIVPVRLAIPRIGVDTTVESRGTQRYTNPFTGKAVSGYGVPESMRTVSWWSDGPRPGSGQMAVLLGHTQVGGYGVFNDLTRLRAGDPVTLTSSDGSVLRLTVLGAPVTGLDKSTSALADALNGHPAGADIALVTCGGPFDEAARQSEDNDVVFATVVRS
jgi:Sortase domain